MSQKDEAVGRVIRILEQCDTATIVRFADEIEQTVEVGPFGVRSLPQEDWHSPWFPHPPCGPEEHRGSGV